MYRYVFDKTKMDDAGNSSIIDISFPRTPVKTADDLLNAIEKNVNEACGNGKAVLALSGGIDSAILAKFMPKGSKAYTFRCIVQGKQVTYETEAAHRWAKLCGLKHEIIDIYWEDVECC